MFDRQKFHGKVVERGFSLDSFAKEMGINPSTLSRKMSGESDFFRKEIEDIARKLRMTQAEVLNIFFAE